MSNTGNLIHFVKALHLFFSQCTYFPYFLIVSFNTFLHCLLFVFAFVYVLERMFCLLYTDCFALFLLYVIVSDRYPTNKTTRCYHAFNLPYYRQERKQKNNPMNRPIHIGLFDPHYLNHMSAKLYLETIVYSNERLLFRYISNIL